MAPARAFRFGVTAQPVDTAAEWRALARKIEDLGYSTLFHSDHFGEQLAPVPALGMAAEATNRLRVGMLVAANDFRHPVMHAKELATLDLLSDGRVEWGIGAGWLAPEYKAAGIPFDPPAVRVSRLEESVAVMRALFAEGDVNHEGDHYRLTGVDGFPKPVQRPHPPLLVGGAQRRLLSFAARTADIVGVNPLPPARPAGRDTHPSLVDAVDRQIDWIRAAAGKRFDELELSAVAFPALVTGRRGKRIEQIAARRGISRDELLASPHVILGTVDQICERLEAHRQRWGVSYWVVPAASAEALGPVVARLTGR